MRIKLGPEEMRYIALFETITFTRPKDCLVEENEVTFVVDQQDLGRCVGRDGCNIKKIQNRIGRAVRVVGFSGDLAQFIRNLLAPAQIVGINLSEDGRKVTVRLKPGSKGLAMGEGKRKFNRAKKLLERFFGVRDIILTGPR